MPPSELEHTVCISHNVHFDANVKVYLGLSREEYTRLELEECFYSSKERHQMHRERRSIVSEIERTRTIRKRKTPSAFRGLETLTRDGSVESQNRIRTVVDNVLNEQENQRTTKVCDSTRIATASRSASTESTLLSLRFAIFDQQAAFKVYRRWAVNNPVVFSAIALHGQRFCLQYSQ